MMEPDSIWRPFVKVHPACNWFLAWLVSSVELFK